MAALHLHAHTPRTRCVSALFHRRGHSHTQICVPTQRCGSLFARARSTARPALDRSERECAISLQARSQTDHFGGGGMRSRTDNAAHAATVRLAKGGHSKRSAKGAHSLFLLCCLPAACLGSFSLRAASLCSSRLSPLSLFPSRNAKNSSRSGLGHSARSGTADRRRSEGKIGAEHRRPQISSAPLRHPPHVAHSTQQDLGLCTQHTLDGFHTRKDLHTGANLVLILFSIK
jgi:hypothetical protein